MNSRDESRAAWGGFSPAGGPRGVPSRMFCIGAGEMLMYKAAPDDVGTAHQDRETCNDPQCFGCLLTIGAALMSAPALAQTGPTPENEDGRFSFNRAGEGYLRLDSRTGQVSQCTRRAVGWACQAVPDERATLESEISRLQAENAGLKKQLLANNVPLPEGMRPDEPGAKPEAPTLRLPSEAEINRAVSYLSEVWRRLVEAMTNLQNDIMKKT